MCVNLLRSSFGGIWHEAKVSLKLEHFMIIDREHIQ